jgi:hypothetical protein
VWNAFGFKGVFIKGHALKVRVVKLYLRGAKIRDVEKFVAAVDFAALL